MIAAGLSIASGIGSILGGRKAQRAADRQAAEEARMEEAVTIERVRQIEREEDIMRGATIAGSAGSGVRVSSQSVLDVLADQAAEFGREREITEQVGASRTAAALERGRMTGQQAKYSSYATALGMFGNAATDIYRIFESRK